MTIRTDPEIHSIAQKMVLRVLEMEPGDRTTVARLVNEIEPSLLDEHGDTMFDDPIDLVTEALFDLAGDEGDLLLDMSEHDGKVEGLPYNLDFIVRRRIGGKHLNADELLDKMEWFYFTVGGYFQGHPEITFRKDDESDWVIIDEQDDPFYSKRQKASDVAIEKLKQVVKGSGALAWDDSYWEPILDGTQWELQLRFSDGTYFESSGSNSYPAGFNALVNGLISLGLNIEAYDYEGE